VEGGFLFKHIAHKSGHANSHVLLKKIIKYAKSIGVDRVGFCFQNVKAHKPKGGQQNYIEVQFVSKYQLVY
jgi:hypothetical protein